MPTLHDHNPIHEGAPHQTAGTAQAPLGSKAAAEELLRELAFVLHATQKVRNAILESKSCYSA